MPRWQEINPRRHALLTDDGQGMLLGIVGKKDGWYMVRQHMGKLEETPMKDTSLAACKRVCETLVQKARLVQINGSVGHG